MDDDSFNIMSNELILKRLNVECDSCFNGREAVNMVKKNNNYDFVLMDCNMPVLNGWDATREILELVGKKEVNRVVIIACTAYDDASSLKKCTDAGMEYIL